MESSDHLAPREARQPDAPSLSIGSSDSSTSLLQSIPTEKRPRAAVLLRKYQKAFNTTLSASSTPDDRAQNGRRRISTSSIQHLSPSRRRKSDEPMQALPHMMSNLKFDSKYKEHEHLNGGRKKALDHKTKAKAALIRHLGACQSCRKRKVTCSLSHHDIDSLKSTENFLDTEPIITDTTSLTLSPGLAGKDHDFSFGTPMSHELSYNAYKESAIYSPLTDTNNHIFPPRSSLPEARVEEVVQHLGLATMNDLNLFPTSPYTTPFRRYRKSISDADLQDNGLSGGIGQPQIVLHSDSEEYSGPEPKTIFRSTPSIDSELDSEESSHLGSEFEIDDTRYADLICLQDIVQDEFQKILETKNRRTQQDFSLVNDSLVSHILESSWSWFKSGYTPSLTACTGSPCTPSGSSPNEKGCSGKSWRRSEQGGKRKWQSDDNDGGDKQQIKRMRNGAVEEKLGKERLQFACPFRKHNPTKYGVMHWIYCSVTPYPDVSRLKEHLIRGPHRVWECDRCRSGFKTNQDKVNHAREEIACMRFTGEYVPEEGIHQSHVDWLKTRGKCYSEEVGKSYTKQTEEERWITIYKKLFSCGDDDELPSPYFEAPIEERTGSSNSQDIVNFQQYFREELPRAFRRRAANSFDEDSINRALNIFSQCASSICTRFSERSTNSPYLREPGHTSQSESGPSQQINSLSSLETPMPTNSSFYLQEPGYTSQSISGPPQHRDSYSSFQIPIHTSSSNINTLSSIENNATHIRSPSNSESTPPMLILDTRSPQTQSGSGSLSQDVIVEPHSPFHIPQLPGAKIPESRENQVDQDIMYSGLDLEVNPDIDFGSLDDFIAEIDDSTGLGCDLNTGWNGCSFEGNDFFGQ